MLNVWTELVVIIRLVMCPKKTYDEFLSRSSHINVDERVIKGKHESNKNAKIIMIPSRLKILRTKSIIDGKETYQIPQMPFLLQKKKSKKIKNIMTRKGV